MLQGLKIFLNYWYFRYLLVTELFMVEKWERTMFHIVLFIFLTVLSLFNASIILRLVSALTQPLFVQNYGLEETNQPLHGEL